jgi:hypothetical protein
MTGRFYRSGWVLALATTLVGAGSLGACGSGATSSESSKSVSGSGTGSGTGGMGGLGGGGTGGNIFTGPVGAGGSQQAFDVEPSALETLVVPLGKTTPTQLYKATVNGAPVSVKWSVDEGALGSIPAGPSTQAVFAPTGTTGGLVNVLATLGGKTVQRQVFIKLGGGATQNGPNTSPGEQAQMVPGTTAGIAQLIAGGGVGGVGGEGLGPAVTDMPTIKALGTPTGNGQAQGLTLLYPYDKTVWPRGMLAPLLMWSWAPGDADAIQISLKTTSGSFSWTGMFGRPPILGTPGSPITKYIRSPIPQDVWDTATNTAGGTTPNNVPDQLVVSLTVAQGGKAYGPITETWNVAPARMAGTVYYNSYGTQLVKNSTDYEYGGVNQYGAAVLAIQGSSTAPVVIAGTNATPAGNLSGDGCRVCHVVAGDGSHLIVEHGNDYSITSSYDLKNANAETVLTGNDGIFGWAGLSTDSSLALTNAAQLAADNPTQSNLFTLPPAMGATPAMVTGIPADLQAGAPAFSPDDTHVAFELMGGTVGTFNGTTTGTSQLISLDFDKATMTFSNPKLLAMLPGGGNPGGGGQNAGLPSFFPTNDAVAFHNQITNPSASHRYNTWQGATAQVWWSDLKTGTPAMLGSLNGFDGTTSYLPTGPNHMADTNLNYEPTVAPVVSGGYAWVIFTTRRLYGNLATQDPTLSDPRDYDSTQYANITPKKLWVAAVDIGAIKNGVFVQGWTPGSDPSHPAFYLPAQELVAGNARGFWVLDPCQADGTSCMTGDQCCNGFCEPGSGDAGLVCASASGSCSGLQEKCTTAADCCDSSALCINGFCSLGTPPARH